MYVLCYRRRRLGVTVEESSGASGNIPDHEAYTSRYQEVTEIDRVQCEIGCRLPHWASERLDLGVFADDLRVTVTGGDAGVRPERLSRRSRVQVRQNINYLRYRPDDDAASITTSPPTSNGLVSFPMMSVVGAWCSPTDDLLRRDADVAAEQELHELADRFDVDDLSSYCRPHQPGTEADSSGVGRSRSAPPKVGRQRIYSRCERLGTLNTFRPRK